MKIHNKYIIKVRGGKSCWKITVEHVTKTSVLIKFENLEKPVRMLTTQFESEYEVIEKITGIATSIYKTKELEEILRHQNFPLGIHITPTPFTK